MNELKVKNLYGLTSTRDTYYSHYLSDKIKKFVEEGEYNQILDINIYGTGAGITCTILYEEKEE